MTKKVMLRFMLLFVLTQILFLLSLNYINYVEIQINLSNVLISSNAVTLIFQRDDSLSLGEIQEIVKEYPEIKLFYDLLKNYELQIYGYCGDPVFTPDIYKFLDGKFIEKEDLFQRVSIAVVGENILSLPFCISSQNEYYFELYDLKYHINGILSSKFYPKLENTIFVNLDSLYAIANFQITKITVDGPENQIRKLTQQILETHHAYEMKNNNFVEQYFLDEFHVDHVSTIVFAFIVVVAIANSIILFLSLREERKVMKILGIPLYYLFLKELKYIALLVLASIILMCGIYGIIYLNFLEQLCLNIQIFDFTIFSCIEGVTVFMTQLIGIVLYDKIACRNGVK